MRIAIALFVLIFVAGSAAANSGLALLKVEAGARPSGMGGAFVTIDKTPDAVSYNPAGAVGVTNFTVSLGHNSYWEDIRMETSHFAMGLSPKVYLHGGVRFATVSNLEMRGDVPTAIPDGIFDAHDISFKGGLAFRITDRLSTGFSMGWIIEKIGAHRGSVFNFDYGLQAQASKYLAFGLSATNIGSDFVLSKATGDESDLISLPTTYRLGTSYHRDRYRGAFELVHVDDRQHLHLGTEVAVHRLFQVRAGWVSNYDTEKFSAGASFTKRNITVDYAFVPYRRGLGTSHMFNLSFTL
ncbi:MAG: PorV/PorQ family protein [candidate division Zixibacteria bacterium]|nr:PorV/PorQ family protein [candidate division Zixibacteria bacterium]